MHSARGALLGNTNRQIKSTNATLNRLNWAKFRLARRTMNWLLILLTVYVIAAPAITALVLRTDFGRRLIVVGVLMSGTIGCIGKLVSNLIRAISEIGGSN